MNSPTDWNEENNTLTIRVRPLIRYLAAMIGVVIALPQIFALTIGFWEPQYAPDSVTIVTSSALLSGIAFLTYRWLTLHASVSKREIRVSRHFRTVKIPVEQFGRVEIHARGQWKESTTYYLYDKNGKKLAVLPGALTMSPNFVEFLDRLNALSAA